MSEISNKNDGVDFFIKTLDTQGVAVSTVKDGHILAFKREHLQQILDAHPDQEKIIIFIKQPEFKN